MKVECRCQDVVWDAFGARAFWVASLKGAMVSSETHNLTTAAIKSSFSIFAETLKVRCTIAENVWGHNRPKWVYMKAFYHLRMVLVSHFFVHYIRYFNKFLKINITLNFYAQPNRAN